MCVCGGGGGREGSVGDRGGVSIREQGVALLHTKIYLISAAILLTNVDTE